MDACISSAKRCASVASFASRHLVEVALTETIEEAGVVATVTAEVFVSLEEATVDSAGLFAVSLTNDDGAVDAFTAAATFSAVELV